VKAVYDWYGRSQQTVWLASCVVIAHWQYPCLVGASLVEKRSPCPTRCQLVQHDSSDSSASKWVCLRGTPNMRHARARAHSKQRSE